MIVFKDSVKSQVNFEIVRKLVRPFLKCGKYLSWEVCCMDFCFHFLLKLIYHFTMYDQTVIQSKHNLEEFSFNNKSTDKNTNKNTFLLASLLLVLTSNLPTKTLVLRIWRFSTLYTHVTESSLLNLLPYWYLMHNWGLQSNQVCNSFIFQIAIIMR